ncbi:hypothetical protein F2P56_003777 [Juglans regia]|uniref:S phase cyclin A-associated protein in the endoplasmic reticulum N-terminal domain-containing protein n=2 Tax=Juglans regia TaxID=51240 RepID=A0A833Y741_JUGRE|nr:uncharacterized protein LOC109002532 isoform X1 [Juglans regia]KAF5477102.1 hypothetical protein F2P56_003777 [Juglans regia]
MENSGEAVDDQGSGWFQVKKKHRSSSKFSLQSWVGGFSGKNPSNFLHSQPSLNENNGNSRGKRRSQLPKAGGNNAVGSQSSVINSIPVLDEDKKGVLFLDKCVVQQDNESPNLLPLPVANLNGGTGDIEKTTQKDKPDVVHKIKWGDLEDDALLLHHENTDGAGIKFGDIGSHKLDACRKNVNNHYVVSSVASCANPQHNNLVATADADICGNEVSEKNCISVEDAEVPIANDQKLDPDDEVSNCKDIHTEHVKSVNGDLSSTGFSCAEVVGIEFKLQAPDIIPDADDTDSSEIPVTSRGSSAAAIDQNAELFPPKKSGSEISGDSTVTYPIEDQGAPSEDTIHDDSSSMQIGNSLGECQTGESKERFRQRLWCFLFENLNRAVDELYLLCELECDVEQMKEAILVLEEAASDFKELNARVEEFENVKRSSPQLIDGAPITLKSDHRRPHALSWEVRRMTTSTHKAEILSSSLEAFKKIQKERASMCTSNDAKILGSECYFQSDDNLNKSSEKTDATPNARDSQIKSRRQSASTDLILGNITGEKRNIESGRSCKVNLVQNGRVPPHNSSFSEFSSSRPPPRDISAAFTAGKSKREQPGSDADRFLSKKEKNLAESVVEKNSKSTDHFKRQIPLSEKEKEKERRNAAPWKSMDAWKEKRNWEEILSSPFRVSTRVSHSPGMSRKSAERARILRDKLMSPEKKKKKAAIDLKKEAEEKHARAMRIRSELENERVQKLQRNSEKLNRVNEWQAVRNMKLREGMFARHQRGESRHEAFLAQVVKRAGDESSKVNEVRFITSLNEENKKLILRQKLHDSELRRAEKLQVIKTKQKEDMAREEAVLERRKLIEAEKLQRLAETQRKKEEAQIRREEERKASSAAREARAMEQLRRKEERVKAQQEEAELLAQKLAERLSESEQRRKFYLEQIRERASMDFRDQPSPLSRRSVIKDGQGRVNEDYQANIITGLGGSALAMGNVTMQHSLKRRIKRIRQRLMALKYEFPEPPVGAENAGIGYRTAVGTARMKIGRWLQELQRLRQARKEGAASIGLIIAEMIKYLEGKDPELQASRQAGLLDFIASALPASHTSKPEACQVTIHLLKLLRVVLSVAANRSYFLAQNLLPPIIPMLSAALENYIKIAASLNVPGNINFPSSKTSTENFESISEVLDGFLWTVTTIIGHISTDERQLQMRDGLLELLVAYQVVHRLRDLFALYDRPQVEGSPFPSSILLSIYMLVVLTSRPQTDSSIDWESCPGEVALGNKSDEATLLESVDSGYFSVTNFCGDNRPPLSVLNGSTVVYLPDVPEDRPLDELSEITKKNVSSMGKDAEKEQNDSSVEVCKTNTNKTDAADESQIHEIVEPFAGHKDEKHSVTTEQKSENILRLDQPLSFLLSAISETGLVSLPSLLTAVLLQANNRLSNEQASYVLPSNFEEVATGVLKVLNNLAILDLKFMQRMLARSDLKMEFFHLMSFLLSYCTSKWKIASDKVGLLLLESLLLLSHFALFHLENQAVLRWGKSPTVLHKVCDLPFVFFSDPDLMPVLAGTLVAACYGSEQNKGVVQQEISIDMLLSLLRSCRNILPSVQSNSTLDNSMGDDSSEINLLGPECKKPQVESALRFSRNNARSARAYLGKAGSLVNSIRNGKMRNQRDGKTTKASEEMALKQNLPASETNTVMLYSRFPSSFIDRAERFFSVGCLNVGDEA